MPSATDFLPARMIEFMNFETTRFLYFGSGLLSRFSSLWWRYIVFLFLRHGRARPGHPRVFLSRSPGLASLARAINAKRPNHLGRFAPYLERLCLRFFTPWVSSTPRRIW